MLLLTVDRTRPVPAYRQIYERVVRLVDAGELAPGDRLPPTRTLARTLGVHRSTVLRAYDELWALGYLESRQGSYSTVRRRAPGGRRAARRSRADPHPVGGPPDAGPRRAQRDVARLAEERAPRGAIDFARLSADPTLAPHEDVRRCLKSALVRRAASSSTTATRTATRPLREAISRRMRAHGVAVSADEILVTNGAQQGLDLVAAAAGAPGRRGRARVADLRPGGLALFRLHGLELSAIPMRPDGLDLDRAGDAARAPGPALVYTIPNFHNPTGITTGQGHRERLLALCEARRVPIVEDGFEEEMKYFGRPSCPSSPWTRAAS